MKSWMLAALAAAATLASGHAAAQFKDAKDAIEYRQGAMHVLGNHFGRVGAMVNNKVPFDAKAVQINAEIVAMMVKLPWAGFGVPGSDKGDTEAKAEVWSQPEKFKEAALKTQDAAEKLNAAAKTGSQDQVKVAFGDMAKTCKACHEDFRKKD
jgi:cytochrome c556